MSILDDIVAHKLDEVRAAKARRSPEAVAGAARQRAQPVRDLRAALLGVDGVAIVAEVKRRSPSRGELCADFDPVACARQYVDGGAAAISVLTDEHFFGGSLEDLEAVRAAVALPVLRKDFLVDPYQVDESCAHGADAVLLIVSALDPERLEALHARAVAYGLAALVEVHDEEELERALALGATLVGVNHRDLRTFEMDLDRTVRLAPRVPSGVVLVAESGIFDHDQIQKLREAGAHAFLVGESLMRESHPAAALRALRGEA